MDIHEKATPSTDLTLYTWIRHSIYIYETSQQNPRMPCHFTAQYGIHGCPESTNVVQQRSRRKSTLATEVVGQITYARKKRPRKDSDATTPSKQSHWDKKVEWATVRISYIWFTTYRTFTIMWASAWRILHFDRILSLLLLCWKIIAKLEIRTTVRELLFSSYGAVYWGPYLGLVVGYGLVVSLIFTFGFVFVLWFCHSKADFLEGRKSLDGVRSTLEGRMYLCIYDY